MAIPVAVLTAHGSHSARWETQDARAAKGPSQVPEYDITQMIGPSKRGNAGRMANARVRACAGQEMGR